MAFNILKLLSKNRLLQLLILSTAIGVGIGAYFLRRRSNSQQTMSVRYSGEIQMDTQGRASPGAKSISSKSISSAEGERTAADAEDVSHAVESGTPSSLVSISSVPFRVAQYNVLAPVYTLPSRYSFCSRELLEWTHRRQLILSDLLSFDADIICLQVRSFWTPSY